MTTTATIPAGSGDFPFPILDLSQAFEVEPPRLDFVLPGLLAGTVGALVAPGATGKSFVALEAAVLVGGGGDLLGFGDVKRGRSLLLTAEDPSEVLHQRVHALGAHLGPGAREEVKENLIVAPCLGVAGDLMDDGATAAAIRTAGGGCRLIVIDTLSRWHTGEENERRDAARVMRQLEKIAVGTGAAVVFLHHVNKSAALGGEGDKQQAARGSSVFVDEARWVAFLQTATREESAKFGIEEELRRNFVRYGVSKANYCPPQPDIWLRRETGGVLVKYEYDMKPVKRRARKAEEDDDF